MNADEEAEWCCRIYMYIWNDQVNFYFEMYAFYAFNMQINYIRIVLFQLFGGVVIRADTCAASTVKLKWCSIRDGMLQ